MLIDFLLRLATDPGSLEEFEADRSGVLAQAGLPSRVTAAIVSGDLYGLRKLLYAEAREGDRLQPYLASDYTVSTSGDTPHCPIIPPNPKKPFDLSFWSFMEPDDLWDRSGLTIVGTGIRAGLQTTPEARMCIERADKVLYLVADLVAQRWIEQLNPTATSMQHFYREGPPRREIYEDIVEEILTTVRSEKSVCVVFYGHPGAFVYPAHEAVRLARQEGFPARMLPGVSAEANLLADLGVDPGVAGLQSYEATNFLLNKYRFDSSAALILWQVGLIGDSYWRHEHAVDPNSLAILADYLSEEYGAPHEVVLYEAAELPAGAPRLKRLQLSELAKSNVSGVATLYVPPKAPPSPDLEMAERLQVV